MDNVFSNLTAEEKQAKIEELKEIIATAEETMKTAKRLLANLEPNSLTDLERSTVETAARGVANPAGSQTEENPEENVVYGFFDGQLMIGDDGKQYPVPANYASKSKLVEGDRLKLTITPDNRFVYKQVGPVQRNYLIGIVKKDDKGNFVVETKEGIYRVLPAAAAYFQIEPGDEVTLIVPQNGHSVWGALENVLQKKAVLVEASEQHHLNTSVKKTAERVTVNEKGVSEEKTAKAAISAKKENSEGKDQQTTEGETILLSDLIEDKVSALMEEENNSSKQKTEEKNDKSKGEDAEEMVKSEKFKESVDEALELINKSFATEEADQSDLSTSGSKASSKNAKDELASRVVDKSVAKKNTSSQAKKSAKQKGEVIAEMAGIETKEKTSDLTEKKVKDNNTTDDKSTGKEPDLTQFDLNEQIKKQDGTTSQSKKGNIAKVVSETADDLSKVREELNVVIN